MDVTTIIVITTLIISLIWLVVLTTLWYSQQQFFKKFTADISKKDLKSALRHINNKLDNVEADQKETTQLLQLANKAAKSHFQNMAFLRFNPYSDTGGDQSFCLCLLDERNSGIVITSLHSREQTRIYAKLVRKGQIEGGILSKEEERVLKQAIHN